MKAEPNNKILKKLKNLLSNEAQTDHYKREIQKYQEKKQERKLRQIEKDSMVETHISHVLKPYLKILSKLDKEITINLFVVNMNNGIISAESLTLRNKSVTIMSSK